MLRHLQAPGVLAGVFFIIMSLGLGFATPGYNPVSQFVSELGARDAVYAPIANWGMILPFGLLIVFAAIAGLRRPGAGILAIIACVLLALAGAGYAIAAVQPCDAGCSFMEMSPSAVTHNLAAFGAFILGLLALAFFVFSELLRRRFLTALVHFAAFLVMSGAFAAMGQAGVESPYIGALQRGYLYSFCLWLIFWGIQSRAVGQPTQSGARA